MRIDHSTRPRSLMRSVHRLSAHALHAATAALLVSLAAAPARAATAYALTNANQLVVFDTAAPGSALATVTITGLQTGETVLGIDVRPATGQLYALGSTSRVYVIDVVTGVARVLGAGPLTTPLSGTNFGFDFNPTVDRIRVTSDFHQNFRLHPDTGALVTLDTNLTPVGAAVAEVAYINNYSGAGGTTLFGIDSDSDQLVMVGGVNGTPSPNGGVVTAVGPLGVNTTAAVGFDVSANDGVAFAALTVGVNAALYRINLATGAATLVGTIATAAPVRGLAIQSRAVTLYGVTTANQLVRFHSASPASLIAPTKTITGLQAGESILGIDFRPSTGELYGLGSTSRLYKLSTATGVATAVSAAAFAPALSGTEFGFDFNPTVDRIRVVSNTSQNFRLNPDTGLVAGTDTPLTHNAVPDSAVGAAYTNSFDGATQTTLYTLDAVNDRLGLQGSIGGTPTSPNTGIVTDVGALGVDTTNVADLEISAEDNTAFAVLTVAGTPVLYTVSLTTGAATPISVIGSGVPIRALASMPTNYNMAEGSTGTFFDTDLLVLNPNAMLTPAMVTYLRDDGVTVTQGIQLTAQSRTTVSADSVPGLESAAFSSVVTSPLGLPLVVERTMRWDATQYGSHTDKATQSLSRKWYFAEGSQGFFDTFLLLANPSAAANNASVEFLREGAAPVVKNYVVPARSRLTIYTGAIAELANSSFGITVTFARAAAAERSMYFGTPVFNAGHESAGAPAPSTSWFLAEGATGDFFTTFLLLANPGDTAANVTLNYFKEAGGLVTRTKTIAPRSRLTINIATEDSSLAATAVATQVISDVPVVAERAQYWPQSPSQWREAHNSFGVTATAPKWGLAEGRTGGPTQYLTYILLANPDSIAANVTLTFMRTTGAPFTKNVVVPANGRLTVSTGPGSSVPELVDESFGAVVTSDRPIFAERAMYSNDTNGVFWAAGSNATATAVP